MAFDVTEASALDREAAALKKKVDEQMNTGVYQDRAAREQLSELADIVARLAAGVRAIREHLDTMK
jgi:hypothetical protein